MTKEKTGEKDVITVSLDEWRRVGRAWDEQQSLILRGERVLPVMMTASGKELSVSVRRDIAHQFPLMEET